MITITVNPPKNNPTVFDKLFIRQQVEDNRTEALLAEKLEAVGMIRADFEKMPYSYRKSLTKEAELQARQEVRQYPLDTWAIGEN